MRKEYHSRIRVLSMMFFWLTGSLAVLSNTQSSIVPRPSFLVTGSKIDASTLLGENGPQSLKDALSKISIGVITKPLGELTVKKSELEQLLGSFAKYFDLPQKIRFRRKGDLLSGAEITARIREIVKEKFLSMERDEPRIDSSRIPSNLVLPGNLISWDIEPLSSNLTGMVLFSLAADCSEGKVRQIFQVEVKSLVKAAKFVRLLKPGHVIKPEDVVEEMIHQKNGYFDQLVPYSEALGKKLAIYKSPGTFFRKSDIVAIGETRKNDSPENSGQFKSPGKKSDDNLVKPGEKVDFKVNMGGLSLKVPAKALQGGGLGDAIKLVNLQNNRQISGVITARGQVEYGQD